MLGSEPSISFFFTVSLVVSSKGPFDTDGDRLDPQNTSVAGVAFKMFFK